MSQTESGSFEHTPVMLEEVLGAFADVPPGLVVDATVGGAGHAKAILERFEHLRILGLDQDPRAVAAGSARLAEFGDRARIVHARFDRIGEVLDRLGADQISGVLFDLGVSSVQFDEPERGFSYRSDAAIDMRMNPTEGISGAELLNTAPERELARLFYINGERRFAKRIARAIVAARPLTTTGQLAQVTVSAIPAAARRTGGHPAKRVFQAVRIAVNEELDVLPVALEAAIDRLAPAGRIVVLSYHSGEDRIVKATFVHAATGGCICPPGLDCVCGAVSQGRIVNRGSRKPTALEVSENPRSQSARMRVFEATTRTKKGGEAS